MRFMMPMISKGYASANPGTMPEAKMIEAMTCRDHATTSR